MGGGVPVAGRGNILDSQMSLRPRYGTVISAERLAFSTPRGCTTTVPPVRYVTWAGFDMKTADAQLQQRFWKCFIFEVVIVI